MGLSQIDTSFEHINFVTVPFLIYKLFSKKYIKLLRKACHRTYPLGCAFI